MNIKPSASDGPRHHYIPQFILRNFPEAENNDRTTAEKRECKTRKKVVLIRYYNLEIGQLERRRTQSAYQVRGMYRDARQSDIECIEKALASLEGRAAPIIAKIKTAQTERKISVSLLGSEQRILRKFLYVMQYRAKSQRQKLQCSLEEYTGPDKEQLKEYIRKHNMTSPNDVWLETLRLILLEAPETVDQSGYEGLEGKMYDADYYEFRHNIDNFFVCICEPESADEEFIMSDNAFCIMDGRPLLDGSEPEEVAHHMRKLFNRRIPVSDYHKFAPISPRLAIVLRNRSFRKEADIMAYQLQVPVGNQKYASVFEDLPVKPANPRYVNGFTLKLPDGSTQGMSFGDFQFSMNDTYEMGIYPIPTKHVRAINAIQIDKVNDGLTFCSTKAMASSLNHYLATYKTLPFAISAEKEYATLARQRSAKTRLLHLLENPSNNTRSPKSVPKLCSPYQRVNYIEEWTRDTNYLKLANGSLDMFDSDMKAAQRIENERNYRMRELVPWHADWHQKMREWEIEKFKDLDTRILLLTIRLNQVKDPFKSTSKGWLAPTKAEECVFKLWGKPGVSRAEFNILLDEALWKEGYRNAAQNGLKKKYSYDRKRAIMTLIYCEVVYSRKRGGSVIEWAKRTNLYGLFLQINYLLASVGLASPRRLDDASDSEQVAEIYFREFLRRFLFSTENEVYRTLTTGLCPDLEDQTAPWKELLTVWLYPVPDDEWCEARWNDEESGFGSMANFFEVMQVSGRSKSGLRMKGNPSTEFSAFHILLSEYIRDKVRRGESFGAKFPSWDLEEKASTIFADVPSSESEPSSCFESRSQSPVLQPPVPSVATPTFAGPSQISQVKPENHNGSNSSLKMPGSSANTLRPRDRKIGVFNDSDYHSRPIRVGDTVGGQFARDLHIVTNKRSPGLVSRAAEVLPNGLGCLYMDVMTVLTSSLGFLCSMDI